MCSKEFSKRQYLHLHMVACYKKSGLGPPHFKKRVPVKAVKPLLFVCKTCNRAFSMRQNMVQHAVACAKRRKESNTTVDDLSKSDIIEQETKASSDTSKQGTEAKSDTDKRETADKSDTSKQGTEGKSDNSKQGTEATDSNSEKAVATSRTEPSSSTLEEQTGAEATSAEATSAGATSAEATSAEAKSAEAKSAEATSAEDKPAEAKSAEATSAEAKSAEAKSAAAKVTEAKSTEAKFAKSKPVAKVSEKEPNNYDADDIMLQLSPSDEAKQEELKQSPPDTPTSLALGRGRRSIKPKQFSDGTIRLIEKVPEVVMVQQADGSQVYKLRKDVEEPPVAAPTKVSQSETEDIDIVKAKDTKGTRILIQGESVPLLDAEHEAKISRMVDMRKLLCLKCNRQYGSSSNLRRHAVRHLGWRRYKCKLCKFTSYNKSECKSHLRKCHHSEVSTLLDGGLAPYIIDLGALLDDNTDEVPAGAACRTLNLSLPSAADTSTANPTTHHRTRAKSKEPVVDRKSASEKSSSTKRQGTVNLASLL